MLQDISFAIWFLLPAAIANAAPVFVAAIPAFKRFTAPLDAGKTFRGRPIFGPHKTWRGLISGIIVATIVLWLQQVLVAHFSWTTFFTGTINYETLPTLLLGPIFALGALGGDAIESFFKRQRGIRSGGAWVPFDQLDYIIGSLLLTLPFVILTPMQYVWICVFWFSMHLLISYIGYRFGLKKEPI